MKLINNLKNIFYGGFFSLFIDTVFLLIKLLFWLRDRRKEYKKISLDKIKSVLIARLDEIGDVVLTIPLLRELRRNLPWAWITLVVKPELYNLIEPCPYVNEVLTYDWNVSGGFRDLKRHLRALKIAIFCLWRRRFDLAILPRWDTDRYHGSYLVYFSAAKQRLAYSEYVNPNKEKANRGYDKLFTHIITDKSLKHEVEHNLEIIKFLGGTVKDDSLELWVNKDDRYFVESIFKENSLNGEHFLIGLGPGAKESRRTWPIERYLSLSAWILEKVASKIVILGDKSEFYLGRYIEEHIDSKMKDRIINLMGKTTLRQLASLLSNCKIYIGNDTGIKHIAAAMKVPVLEISCWPEDGNKFSAKSPYRFAAWQLKHIVLHPLNSIGPCRDECISRKPHCILQVGVEEVKEALNKFLQEKCPAHL